MTRKTAREIAIQLGFAAAATGEEPHELLDRFFEKEHYESLAREDELYAEVPDEKQLAYITRLVTLLDEHRDEIDEHVQDRARGFALLPVRDHVYGGYPGLRCHQRGGGACQGL